MFSNFFPDNCAVCEIMWKNMVEPVSATDDNIILRMRLACWITRATDAHSEYVMLLLFNCNSCYANVPQCYVIHCVCVVILLSL